MKVLEEIPNNVGQHLLTGDRRISLHMKGDFMKRSFVPFFHDDTKRITIYYDYKAQYFFKSHTGKLPANLAIYSGTTGVVFYSLIKNFTLPLDLQYPQLTVLISFIIGCLLALGVIGIVLYFIQKHLSENKNIIRIPYDQITYYIEEGEKWLKSTFKLIIYLLLGTFANTLMLMIAPMSGLLFVTHSIFWFAFIILVWTVRPFKRRKIYNQLRMKFSNVPKSNR